MAVKTKRIGLYLVGLVLALLAAGALFLAVKDARGHDDQTASQSSSSSHTAVNKACQIFTLAEAKKLLGPNAKGGAAAMPQSSPDLDVSTCTYNQSNTPAAGAADQKTASLLLRSPKTDKGTAGNENEFGSFRPSTVQDVEGYGDSAYWDAEHGQLNILKNKNWYILSYGAAAPSSRSLDQTRQLADLLAAKL